MRPAMNIAASAMAWSVRSSWCVPGLKSSIGSNWRSAPRQTRRIAATALSGCLPAAVSCDSITASVPSSTALATSSTSARVGIGDSTIDCIICVAVITTLLRARVSRMIFFCMPGNSASPISTPRSPRATITASDASMISASAAIASARSIFATSAALPPAARMSWRLSSMSAALLANDTARKSTPSFAARRMSSLSLSASAADLYGGADRGAFNRIDLERDQTVVKQQGIADFYIFIQIQIAHANSRDVAGQHIRVAFKREPLTGIEQHRRRSELGDADLRPLQIRQYGHFAAERGGSGAHFVYAALMVLGGAV